ncbi:MAG TPA: oligopeptide/dipeptide ABC transporter ATP-binding protein [Stellaceae bacterium]|nr:oligopeptide/dipeptide ABC transporter ATP-binding protein [Stellaceae bacterium]
MKPPAPNVPPALRPFGPDMRDVGGPRQPLYIVKDLVKHFTVGGGRLGRAAVVQAVDGVNFDVHKGETLGVVGESGCGKSTMGRLLIRLVRPDRGELILDGEEVGAPDGITVRQLQRNVQMVFQDSYMSLNPRLTVEDTIAFGPRANAVRRDEARERAHNTLTMVGLRPELFAQRYPHELSGGQRQRVNIARALAMNPRMLILDEAVSALDKSIGAQVINLLQDLKRHLSLTYFFISHDLGVVRYISDRVLVMYLGKVVEIGSVDAVYDNPRHPYTRALLASQLSMNATERRTKPPLLGDPPSSINPPTGCRFRTRCPLAEEICANREPELVGFARDSLVACHAATPGSGHASAPPLCPQHTAKASARMT